MAVLALSCTPLAAQRRIVSRASPGTTYAVELVTGSHYIWVRGDSGQYHVENGPLVASRIDPGWWSAMWEVEPVDRTFFRVRNRWKGVYLYVNGGRLQAAEVDTTLAAAMWSMADGGAMISGGPPPLPPAVADYRVTLRTGAGPDAMTQRAIYLTVLGPDGRTGELRLEPRPNRPTEAVMRLQPNVGRVGRVTLRNAGPAACQVTGVTIENLATRKTFTRILNAWLQPGETVELVEP